LQAVLLLAFYFPQQRTQFNYGAKDAGRYLHIVIHAEVNEAAMNVDATLNDAHNTGALFLCLSH
jgi:hypothetical protein